MIKHKLSNNKGFTLVETMVIVMVLGTLASIIYIGFNSYLQNVLQTQISTTVHAYQSSLRSYAYENQKFPIYASCLPSGSKCCTSQAVAPTTVYCGNDAEAGWSTNSLASSVAKYVKNEQPLMPVVGTFTNCVAGIMTNGPCKPAGSITTVGLSYIYNTSGAFYTSTDTKVKAFLIYYVGPTYKCGSGEVMTLSGSNLSIDSNAQYTRSTANYRECIVAVTPT